MKAFSSLSGKLLAIAGGLWVLVLVAGFTILEQEEFTPVAPTYVASAFPLHSAIPLAADQPTLLVFVHPYCPCSRASLHELDELLASTQGRLTATIVFTIPDGLPAGWKQSDLWKSAAAMRGVHVLCDPRGTEARRFGVVGSGHALLYDPRGRLLFSGGITPSRGHEGENPGRSAVVSLVLNGHALVSHTPVFGCSLL